MSHNYAKLARLGGAEATPVAEGPARSATSTAELYPDGGNGMCRKLDVVTMTGEEYDALRDEIDGLRKRLSQKMADCVEAEQRQKKDADTYWNARESLVGRIEQLHARTESLRGALRGLLEIEDARIATGVFAPNEEAKRRIDVARQLAGHNA